MEFIILKYLSLGFKIYGHMKNQRNKIIILGNGNLLN